MRKNRPQRQNPQAQRPPLTPRPTTAGAPAPQNLYLLLFLVNLLLAFLWAELVPLFGGADYLIGFGVGFLVIALYKGSYVRRTYDLLYFLGYVLWQIVLSNLILAKVVLQPRPMINPGIVAIPLTASSALEIMTLASVITLTPGTLSVDLGQNERGERLLYVHILATGDPATFQTEVKETFERLLLRFTRGTMT
ncbi:MAG: Na+/H+ antiporter subunit E [Caldilinea sp. CFX5]|nr:Na+/H+ antiporter subunit E [Caldilinea sp. CFX5]